MSISIRHPFKIICQDPQSQKKVAANMDQIALAEIDRHSYEVRVTPSAEAPVPIQMLASMSSAMPVLFSSSYQELNSMVRDAVKDAAAAQSQKGAGAKTAFGQRSP